MKALIKKLKNLFYPEYTLGPEVFVVNSWLDKQVNAELLKRRI